MTREEFKELFLPMSRKLYAISFRFLRNKEEAEDAVQEVYLKLWKMRATLAGYKNPAALAITMIKNLSLDMLRKNRPEAIPDGRGLNEQGDGMSPLALLENSESFMLINKLIEKLPEQQKEAIRMHDIDGLNYSEMEEMTGINASTLRVNLSRARQSIRVHLTNIYNGQEKN